LVVGAFVGAFVGDFVGAFVVGAFVGAVAVLVVVVVVVVEEEVGKLLPPTLTGAVVPSRQVAFIVISISLK